MIKAVSPDHRYTIGVPVPMGNLNTDMRRLQYERAIAYLRGLGHEVIEDPLRFQVHHYHTAPIEDRLMVLQSMLDEPKIDLIMPARGGYGMTQLMPQLSLAHAKSKRMIGFSDFTIFNLLALSHGIVSFSGPMAAVDFGHEVNDPWTMAQCWRTLATGDVHIEVESRSNYQGQTKGILWGTNLTNVVHLLGSPYFPIVQGGVLLIEDIGEEAYSVDRMLMQLEHAGVFKVQKALILGHFNGVDENSDAARAYSFSALLDVWRERLNMPVLDGFPFGHVARKATLPMGCMAHLDINTYGYTLSIQNQNFSIPN